MKKSILFFCLSLVFSRVSNAQTDIINIIPTGNVGISSTAPVSSFEVSGSYGQKVTTITGNTTLDVTYNTVVCNNGGTAINVTLPTASTCTGRVYIIKRNATSTANVTIVPTPTLDGAASFVLTMPYQAIELFSDGAEWKSRAGGLAANASAWGLQGNAGTTASTAAIGVAANNNFLGTTDAKDLVVTTTGFERMRVQAGGNVGIGTTNPRDILHIEDIDPRILTYDTDLPISATRPAWEFGQSSSNFVFRTSPDYTTFTDRVLIDYTGNVGVGITVPVNKLDVAGQVGVGYRTPAATQTAIPHWGNALILSGGTGMIAGYDSDNSDPIWISRYNSGANTSELRVVTGDDPASADDKFVVGAMSGFANYNPAGTWTPYFTVQMNGNVGIGTTIPGQKLTIEGTAPIAEIRSGGYLMIRPTANTWDMRLQAVGTQLDVLSGGSLGTPIASFLHGGNVGIGSISPAYKLDVAGTVNATGGGRFSGTIYTNWTANARIMANADNATGGGIAVSDDGGFFDYNDNYITYNGTAGYGLKIAGNSGSGSNGNLTIVGLGTGIVKATAGLLGLATGADLPSGSGNYIQNQYAAAQSASMWITGQAQVQGTSRFRGDMQIDGGSTLYFGREESFGGADVGGSDYGLIRWDNDNNTYNYWGDSGENGALIIGSQNDAANVASDVVVMNGMMNIFNPASGINYFTGNVGIGVTTPGARLSVKRDATDPGTVDDGKALFVSGVFNPGQSFDGGIEFRHDNLTQGIGFGYNSIYATGSNANQDLNIYSRGASHLTLNAYGGGTGNVGIGTSAPIFHLDVEPGVSNATTRIGSWTFIENVVSSQSMFSRNAYYDGAWKYANTGYATAIRMNDDAGTGDIRFHLSPSAAAGTGITNMDGSDIKMVIRNSGNVGIGTTAPGALLQTRANYTNLNGRLLTSNQAGWAADGATPDVVISNTTTSTNRAALIGLDLHNDATTLNAYSPFITFSRRSNSAAYNSAFAAIGAQATGQGTDANWVAGDLMFSTEDGVLNGLQERMRLTSAGNLGIGTTTPVDELHVRRAAYRITTENSADADGIASVWGTFSTIGQARNPGFGWAGGTLGLSNNMNSDFSFFGLTGTNDDSQAIINWGDDNDLLFAFNATEVIRVKGSTGNVGIGTNNPVQKLEVNGLIVGGRTSEMWTSARSGYVQSTSWTTIPGLSITFTMARAGKVSIVANGTQRSTSGNCHEGYRKNVDGTAYGDGSHGERLVVSSVGDQWWATWSYSSTVSLAAGSHTIAIQTRDSGGNTGCVICAESGGSLQGYTNCDLIITAVYD